ncbi:hypothetical protein [Aestuariivirga sp.]|uniref:hypothetical protein n=1 Tax=Aestuariivirga sp. TaxID=2650926 RepID=UPI0039E5B021
MTMRVRPTLRGPLGYKILMDGLDWSKKNWPPLNQREISMWCATYLESPKIPPDWRFVKLLMWQFLQNFPEPAKSDPREDAEMVDQLIDLGLDFSSARSQVAERHGKDRAAVAKNHQRFGIHKQKRGRFNNLVPENPIEVGRARAAYERHKDRNRKDK